ncbi:MAG: metal-sensitive transcriptional regulator [Microbacterium sp.]
MSSSQIEGDPVTTDTSPASVHDADAQRKIVNRLRRAHGQLAAVINAVESDAHCRDVVQQLAAVSKALDRAGFLVISTALKECLTAADGDGSPQADELEKLFLSLA